MRAVDCDLPGLSRKTKERRPKPPGQHGETKARGRRPSEFKRQMVEKQKIRFNYGIGERQFRRYVREANRVKGSPGDLLIEFIERRLDNVVFRAGFAATIPAARQLVNHGHITVDGKKVDIASYRVKQHQTISLRPKSINLSVVVDSLESPALELPEWIGFDAEHKVATVLAMPTRSSIPFDVDIQLVIEFYSQRL
jgi:small subunit ribosomal protein S4